MPPPNKLTDVTIRNIKPSGKIERHVDGGGLYLEVSVAGGKHWRIKYRVDGKEKRLSFGEWPAVSIKEARDTRVLLSGENALFSMIFLDIVSHNEPF